MTDNEKNKGEVSTETIMSVLAYIGPLVVVSYLVSKDDSFVKFHIKQGLVLLIIEVATWVVLSFLWFFWFLVPIINIFVLVLAIMGIVNAVNKKEKELPLVGSFAKHLKF